MHVHARAVVLKDRLGHEGHRLAVLPSHVLDDILVLQHVVGHLGERVETQIDLRLAGSPDLVMVHFNSHSYFLEREHHLRADVL